MSSLSKVQDDNHKGMCKLQRLIIIFENVLFANANKFVYSTTYTLPKILSNSSETQQILHFTKRNAGVYGQNII